MLENKINTAIRILKIAEKQAQNYNEPVEIAYSGGKDSDVLLALAKMSNINYHAYYKNTTIDPKGTLQHCKENNVTIIKPKYSFFELIKKHGFVSRLRRFCCSSLKEYKVLNVAAIGVRADESTARAKRYTNFESCRVFSATEKVKQYYPLYDWTLTDVKNFILKYNIKLAPYYYVNGSIDFSRRLGCIGCPLQSDNGKKELKDNPAVLRGILRAGQIYFDTHPESHFVKKMCNGNSYNGFAYSYFYTDYNKFFLDSQGGLFEKPDFEKLIFDYFNI